MRTNSSKTQISCVWHNFEVFGVHTDSRVEVYAPVPKWQKEIEISPVLKTPSPSVFSYYSNCVLLGIKTQKNSIWRITRSEWVVFGNMTFFTVSRDGLTTRVSRDPRFLPGQDIIGGAITLLSPGFLTPVQEFGSFFEVLRHTDFYPTLAFLSYARSEELDWSRYPDQPLQKYVWASGDVRVAVCCERTIQERDLHGLPVGFEQFLSTMKP